MASVRGLTTARLFLGRASFTAQKATSAAATPDVKFIPMYKYDNSWSLLDKPNRVREFQEVFSAEQSSDPVFLRGPNDVLLYRGIMGLSVAGIGIALYSIYLMATGNIKKKES